MFSSPAIGWYLKRIIYLVYFELDLNTCQTITFKNTYETNITWSFLIYKTLDTNKGLTPNKNIIIEFIKSGPNFK